MPSDETAEETAEEYFDRIGREIAERKALVAYLAPQLPLTFGSRPNQCDWLFLVSRCPSEVGKFRATRFENMEPVGHSTCDTAAEAVQAAWDYGADLTTATKGA